MTNLEVDREPEPGERHQQAIQEFVKPGQIRRYAPCPEHGRYVGTDTQKWLGNRSSQFRGVQENMITHRIYWAFACKGKGGHIFLALPDRAAPQTAEAYRKWEADMIAERAGLNPDYDGGGR